MAILSIFPYKLKIFFGRLDLGKKCKMLFLMLILTHVSIFKLVGNSGSCHSSKFSGRPWGHPLTLTLTLNTNPLNTNPSNPSIIGTYYNRVGLIVGLEVTKTLVPNICLFLLYLPQKIPINTRSSTVYFSPKQKTNTHKQIHTPSHTQTHTQKHTQTHTNKPTTVPQQP